MVNVTNYEPPHYAAFSRLLLLSPFLGRNILHSSLFPNTLSLCSFLRVRDQVVHPYKITETLQFLGSTREDERF